MNNLANEVRWRNDIGMFTIDRSIEKSCIHKTAFCENTCFNNKLFKLYPAMHGKDARNENAWFDNDAIGLLKTLARRKKQTKRFRFMSRGEAFSNFDDIARVENIVKTIPDTIHWIPTRSWRDAEWEHIKNLNLSTMFFGDNKMLTTPNGDRMFICPKTHKHLSGHCAVCKGGCFNAKKRVDVHLKQH